MTVAIPQPGDSRRTFFVSDCFWRGGISWARRSTQPFKIHFSMKPPYSRWAKPPTVVSSREDSSMPPLRRLLAGAISVGVLVALAVTCSLPAAQRNQAVVRIHKKDLTRVEPYGAGDKAELLIELAHAARLPVRRAGLLWPVAGFELPRAPGLAPQEPFRVGPLFERGPVPPPLSLPPPPLTRTACEEGINREAALAGYIKSRLRLGADQRDAWRKLEDAAEPAVQKIHAACDRLPLAAAPRPSLPEMSDIIEAHLSARLELVRMIREPLKALYEMLTPEQRALLQPPSRPVERL